MQRISSPIEHLKSHYDVVVVGSGYGGGIAASRLSRAGMNVCVLERGREILPGEYPATLPALTDEAQFRTPDGHVGDRQGLFEFHVGADINVLVGCGLGGTSLINANVSIEPSAAIWQDPAWPPEIRQDADGLIQKGLAAARAMLKPVPYPDAIQRPQPAKLEAHRKSGEKLGQPWKKVTINVNFEPAGLNAVGVPQEPCVDCGDCVSGCNHSAKNTTLMNYLPDAWNHDAEIFTGVSVAWLERRGDHWLVWYEILGEGRAKNAAPLFLTAKVVVLGAGTLGSTGILLRSRDKGLSVSGRLGERFSGNGDIVGFAYNADQRINAIGCGQKDPKKVGNVGPTITCVIDERQAPQPEKQFIIEEGAIPGGLAPILAGGFEAAAAVLGTDTDSGVADWLAEHARIAESALLGAYHGAVANTQIYLGMGHDGSDGKIELKPEPGNNLGRPVVDWKGVGDRPFAVEANKALLDITATLGATYVENPIWTPLLKHDLITVHPLGGCALGETAERGVVNHKGQVFSGANGAAVHEGLYVADGSVVPRSLGVNPLLTISALAERTMMLIAKDRGLEISTDMTKRRAAVASPLPGIRFTETMKGYFSRTELGENYLAAEADGKTKDQTIEFTLTIASEDIDRSLSDPAHLFHSIGTVSAPKLSGDPLVVTEGQFQLMTDDPKSPGTLNMIYEMQLHARDGRILFFRGIKFITQTTPDKIWPQTTTLYVSLHDGPDAQAKLIGRGVLHVLPPDFIRLLSTVKVTHAPDEVAKLAVLARFGRKFAGQIFEQYGGVLR